MSEWRQWCKAPDLQVDGDTIDVALPDGRRHRIMVEDEPDGFRLSARVASRSALAGIGEPELFVWQRNRSPSLVGFRLDRYDTMIGELRVPLAGLERDEFIFCVRALATECDRLEVLLTGEDRE